MTEPFKITGRLPKSILMNPFAWMLWTLDFLIWFLSIVGPIRWIRHFSTKPAASQIGEVWRSIDAEKEMTTTLVPDCRTVHELVQRSIERFADRPACGTRTYLGEQQKEGVRAPLKMFGETCWISYEEFGLAIEGFGMGLLRLGLEPIPPKADLQTLAGPHTILIFEETCAHWVTAALGAFSQSIAVATSYATLGMAALTEALSETEARVIVCNLKDVAKIAAACSLEAGLKLTTIVYTTNNVTERLAQARDGSGLQVMSMEEVIHLGGDAEGFMPPQPDTLAVIMYTSGSTGKPKGVMIRHSCMAASVGGIGTRYRQFGMREGTGCHLGYLPAAHILELVAEMATFSLGGSVGYADPKTLSNRGACRKRPNGTINYAPVYPHPPGAIQEFRPTTFPAVPKIWDILKKGVEDKIGGSSGIAKWLFRVAYSARFRAIYSGREAPLFRFLVFRRLKAMMGGRLQIGISGGGPLSADVQTFIRTAFCVPLVQGYALTETTCAGSVQVLADIRPGVVGHPLGSVEVKLRSCVNTKGDPEVVDRRGRPYLRTDRTHHDGRPCMGRGEVLLRGPSVSAGYFKQPEKTAEAFDVDGWFHSGDVAVVLLDGALQIVDRVKNLVKLKGGEYIAIEAMEKEYSTSVYVNGINGGLLCYGDGDMDRPVALVQANCVELRKWATGNGIKFASEDELCLNRSIIGLVLKSLHDAGKRGGLAANEILAGVALISGSGPMEGEPTSTSPWTAENGGLTASNKLNRKTIEAKYADIFEPLKQQGIR